jgi:pimeloyl-ACP methyl ester carboxylesterase
VHLYGTSLGGFLAQLFAQYRPRRVKSLLLSNTFLDNWDFEAIMPWASLCVIISFLSFPDASSILCVNLNFN